MKKIILTLLAALFGAGCVLANEIPTTKAPARAIPKEASMLQVAGQLVKYGYARDNALPLIQAAEIYNTIGARSFKAEKTSEGGTTEGGDKAPSRVSFDPERLLVDATEMAGGDPALLALISKARNEANRGATTAYEETTETVKAGATDVYRVQFRGGEAAMVSVSGDGDTDLDLYIYDSEGNLVASDTDDLDECLCIWYPKYTETYKICIKNYGEVYNQYTIYVN